MTAAVSVPVRVPARPIAVTVGLVALAGYLGFLAIGRLVASSGQLALPGVPDLYLFVGLPVVGLLGWRTLAGERIAGAAAVLRWSARWAGAWAGVTGACLLFATARAAGVSVRELPQTLDNLVRVMASDSTVLAQSGVLWVALLVAFFGSSLTTRWENAALLVLAMVAVLGAVPTAFVPPSHGGHTFHPLVVAAGASQLLAVTAWLGAALALVGHGRLLSAAPRFLLHRYAVAATVALAMVGIAGLVGRAASLPAWGRLWTSTPGWMILAEGVLVAVVLHVGWRHRRRVADGFPPDPHSGVVAVRSGVPTRLPLRTLVLLVGSDLVLGLVVIGLSVIRTAGSG